jgi:transcriptional regulator of acetoin/glycerol metabolism
VWAALAGCPYPWPGNARGLRNVLLKAILWEDAPHAAARAADGERRALVDPEDLRALRAVLEASGHSVSEAARRLGVHRSTIYRKLARH